MIQDIILVTMWTSVIAFALFVLYDTREYFEMDIPRVIFIIAIAIFCDILFILKIFGVLV